MGQEYRSPVLAFVALCLLILSIALNVGALPYHADEDTDQSLDTVEESRAAVNPEQQSVPETMTELDLNDTEDWSDNDDEPQRRDRRRTPIRYPIRRYRGFEQMQSDAKIVFPDMISRVPACKGSTYCEKVDGYPEHVVTQAIQRNVSLRYLASVDEMPQIQERLNANDDTPLCVATEQVIYPQTAENKENQWKYIANQDNFKQGVRIEKCSMESASCNVIGSPGEGYKTTCKQKYVYRQLAAVLSDGTMVPDTFKFPSSCCCHLTFTGSPFPRMAFNAGGQRSNNMTPAKPRRKK
ncbi:protein spaetzle [Megalopta genalis]|uniref:protein spaetzle n=1 Tax=Megalopta genalis TaxID=115081 RepID=UPI0014435BD0|nr:protein spaetzle-like [Megalopta genalis]